MFCKLRTIYAILNKQVVLLCQNDSYVSKISAILGQGFASDVTQEWIWLVEPKCEKHWHWIEPVLLFF